MQVVSRPAPPSESLEVPFVDLRPSHDGVVSGVIDEIATVIETGSFTNGPQVEEFERGYAEYCGVDHCVGTSSGLDALRLGLMALDIKRGDEVIVPANTFIATFEAVAQVGAAPVPAESSTGDMNLDPVAVEAAITSRTRAIVPVHLYGQLADMRALVALSDKHDIPIVEDACQAHGAARNGLVAGAGGAAAAFSFYPAKNLGAFGDAGALTTNDPGIAESVRQLREHGQREKYRHVSIGYTARLDTIQAVVLRHKLPLLDGWNEDRRSIASRYADELVQDLATLRFLPRFREATRLASLCDSNQKTRRSCCISTGARRRRWTPLPRAASPICCVRAPRISSRRIPCFRSPCERSLVAPDLSWDVTYTGRDSL